MRLEGLAPYIVRNYPDVMATVGENLRRLREASGHDQKAIAAEMGVPQSQLSNWENDRYQTLDMRTLLRLAKAYDATVDDLLTGVDEEYEELKASIVYIDNFAGPALARDGERTGEDIFSGYKADDIPVIAEGHATPQPNLFWSTDGTLLSEVEDRISRPSGISDPFAYAIRVIGDSMLPRFKPGERLIAAPRQPVQDGDEVYVELVTGERLIKEARRAQGGWILVSYNPSYPPRMVRTEDVGAMHPIVHITTGRRGRRVVPIGEERRRQGAGKKQNPVDPLDDEQRAPDPVEDLREVARGDHDETAE